MRPRRRGSSVSRSESPKILKAKTVTARAAPGKMAIQGARTKNVRESPLSSAPHDGVSPAPRRKARVDSVRMAAGKLMEVRTIISPVILGRMCRNMMRSWLAPTTVADSTYWAARCSSTVPRMMRNAAGRKISEMASTTTNSALGNPGRSGRSSPRAVLNVRANRIAGKAIRMSAIRLKTKSTTPPRKPAMSASIVPPIVPTMTVAIPILREILPP